MDDKHLVKLIAIDGKLDTMTKLVERHDKDIYRGNGRSGILTRLTVQEDDIDGLEKAHKSQKQNLIDTKEELDDLSKEVSVNWAKITAMATVVSIIVVYAVKAVFG